MSRKGKRKGNPRDLESSKGNQLDKQNDLEDKEKEKAEDKAKNDPAWYSVLPELVTAAASLPFSDPLGAELSLIDANVDVLPGICSLRMRPSIGLSIDRTSPANVAASAFYTHVRYVNSGRKNYDQADLMLYALGIADLYSFVVWCQRIYAYAFMYSQQNWYIGKACLQANGVEPQDVINNLANFRYWVNAFINKISSWAVPADIYLFQQRAFMYGSLYTESLTGSLKDQLYQYVPEGFWSINTTGANGTELDFVKLGSHLTVAQIQAYGESLISSVWADEDFGLMSGDIIKAYTLERCVKLASMGEEAVVIPVFDPYVLHQMKNATPAALGETDLTYTDSSGTSAVADLVSGNVYQNPETGNIVFAFVVPNGSVYSPLAKARHNNFMFYAKHPCISIDQPVVDPAYVMEATRMMAVFPGHNMFTDITPESSGMVIDTGNYLCTGVLLSLRPEDVKEASILAGTYAPSEAWEVDEDADVYRCNQFHYAPLCYQTQMVAGTNWASCRLLSNVENFTLCSRDNLVRIHEVAQLSLMYVPGVAKISGNVV